LLIIAVETLDKGELVVREVVELATAEFAKVKKQGNYLYH
jgi:hypothetical protein